jgi:hypothetical protein
LNQIIPLDKWKTAVLTLVKATIPQDNNISPSAGGKVEEE